MCLILNSGINSAKQNMEKDAELLKSLSKGSEPILHFYEWENDCATFGYFIKPENHLNMQSIKNRGIQLARRPTGGGIVFHTGDYAFSILIPVSHPFFSLNTLDNYAVINQIVASAIYRFTKNQLEPLIYSPKSDSKEVSLNFCMAQPTIYDICIDGKKVGGAAQRQTKSGFLHQGTISLTMPSNEFLNDVLLPDSQIFEKMKGHSYSLLGDNCTKNELLESKVLLKKAIIESFTGLLQSKN